MKKYTILVEGMQCSMCESHVNDAIRQAFRVKKVQSSHTKKETVVFSETPINEQELKEVINKTGYTALSVTSEPYEKKGLFSFRK